MVEYQAFTSTCPNSADIELASQLLSNVQSVIGYFDLDPNRVLDLLYELATASLLTHWRLIIRFFGLSPWFSSQPAPGTAPSIDQKSGNRAAAQILGFKFDQLAGSEEDLQALYLLSALLIKENCIALSDLWTHLSPSEDVFQKGKAEYQDRMYEELDRAKGRNALAVA